MNIDCIILGSQDGGWVDRMPMRLYLPDGTQASEALKAFGLSPEVIHACFEEKRVAIHGVLATADDLLHDGDRLEVLDALRFDPMDSRRRRAEHKRKLLAQLGQKRRRRSGSGPN